MIESALFFIAASLWARMCQESASNNKMIDNSFLAFFLLTGFILFAKALTK